jgi:hypothetical protein
MIMFYVNIFKSISLDPGLKFQNLIFGRILSTKLNRGLNISRRVWLFVAFKSENIFHNYYIHFCLLVFVYDSST